MFFFLPAMTFSDLMILSSFAVLVNNEKVYSNKAYLGHLEGTD